MHYSSFDYYSTHFIRLHYVRPFLAHSSTAYLSSSSFYHRFVRFDWKTGNNNRHTQYVSSRNEEEFHSNGTLSKLLANLFFSYFLFFSSKNAPLYPPPVHFSGQFFPFHYPYERYFILDSRTIQEFSLPFRGTSTFIRCQIKFARAFLT